MCYGKFKKYQNFVRQTGTRGADDNDGDIDGDDIGDDIGDDDGDIGERSVAPSRWFVSVHSLLVVMMIIIVNLALVQSSSPS